jgi:hypothetical protein
VAHTSPEDGNPDIEVDILKMEKGKIIMVLFVHAIANPGNSW